MELKLSYITKIYPSNSWFGQHCQVLICVLRSAPNSPHDQNTWHLKYMVEEEDFQIKVKHHENNIFIENNVMENITRPTIGGGIVCVVI